MLPSITQQYWELRQKCQAIYYAFDNAYYSDKASCIRKAALISASNRLQVIYVL